MFENKWQGQRNFIIKNGKETFIIKLKSNATKAFSNGNHIGMK